MCDSYAFISSWLWSQVWMLWHFTKIEANYMDSVRPISSRACSRIKGRKKHRGDAGITVTCLTQLARKLERNNRDWAVSRCFFPKGKIGLNWRSFLDERKKNPRKSNCLLEKYTSGATMTWMSGNLHRQELSCSFHIHIPSHTYTDKQKPMVGALVGDGKSRLDDTTAIIALSLPSTSLMLIGETPTLLKHAFFSLLYIAKKRGATCL